MCIHLNFFTMRKKSSSIQALYDLCKKTFMPSGPSPPPSQAIQKLCSLLETIRPADVGLKEENQEDDIGHGLLGLNLLNRANQWAQTITYIDIHEGDSFTLDWPSWPWTKTGGNLHCFTAVTPCAVLDILAPPYDEAAGRKGTYYHDYSYSSFATGDEDDIGNEEKEDYAWLAEIDTPEDLYMRAGVYGGPAIQS